MAGTNDLAVATCYVPMNANLVPEPHLVRRFSKADDLRSVITDLPRYGFQLGGAMS